MARDNFTPVLPKVDMQNDTIYRVALDRCRQSVGIIRECDEILEIMTFLPRKPQTDRGALQLAKDLAYVAWDLEERAKEFLDGLRYYEAYRKVNVERELVTSQLPCAA